MKICRIVLDNFCDQFWRCAYKDHKNRSCINYRCTHGTKGHQSEKGRILAVGSYEPAFPIERFFESWMKQIIDQLSEVEADFKERKSASRIDEAASSDYEIVTKLHAQRLEALFSYRNGKFFSLVTCYCCLMNIPQHPLSCGHALCDACVRDFGLRRDENVFELLQCPFHPQKKFASPWTIVFKPMFTGVRILSLDG